MPPKTERLEIRLDPDTLARLDAWSAREDDMPSRSEAVRRLIEIGLETYTREGLRLNGKDRLIVWMLSEIMRHQNAQRTDKKDAKYDLEQIDLIQQVIYGGHYWALNWELSGVMHDHTDDPKNVRAVVDILETWTRIEEAVARFSAEERQKVELACGYRGKDPKFRGFDGNNETELMSIAQFLVEKLGRFQNFKGRDFNSHMPTLRRYRHMAAAFQPMRPGLIGRELSVDQVIELLSIDD